MARTTATLVKGVLQKDYGPLPDGTLPDLTPYIDTASMIIDSVQECATDAGSPMSADRLEMVERWLAAHTYCQMDQPFASNSTAGASASFQGRTDMYLEGTKYGMMAVSLDTSGCLYSIAGGGEKKVATLFWAGKPPSSQVPYSQRD